MTNTKHWSQSKTLRFNLCAALLTVLSEQSGVLQSLLSEGGYVVLTVCIALGNAYLRTITTTALTRRKRK